MKTLLLACLVALLLPLFAASQTPCESAEIIVQLRPGVAATNLLRQLNEKWPAADFKLKRELSKRFNFLLLEMDCQRAAGFDLALLRNEATVTSAIWNGEVDFRQDSLPNDPMFAEQWNLTKIQAPDVWAIAQGGQMPSGKEIVVAVVDSGFDLLHPDLRDNFWRNPGEANDGQDNDGNGFVDDVYGWNFHTNSPILTPASSHGTSVAGVIGGVGNNGEGIAGVNWNVKILPVQYLETAEIIPAIEYVLTMRELHNATGGEKGAHILVMNNSFGLKTPVDCSENPVWGGFYDLLGQAGVLSVAATQNEDLDIDEVGDMPTSCPSEYLITVTNTDSTDTRQKAGYGKSTIDLAAPGFPITTTDIGGGYRSRFQGTSASCPHVAGAIALLYSLPCPDLETLADTDPPAAARLVRDAVLNGVEKVPGLINSTSTGGRLNIYNSMKYLHSYCIAKPKEREQGNFEDMYFGEREIMAIYPNPVTDKLTVSFAAPDFQLLNFRVFNVLGQEMLFEIEEQAKPFEAQILEIDVSEFASGTYFVNIFDLNRKISAKFVKL